MNAALGPVRLLSADDDPGAFDSGVDALDRWLRSTALVASKTGTAATYVLVRGERVVGYYALAMSAVAHQRAPSRPHRGMPDPVPVVLLARLALDRSEHGTGLGGHLLVDALRRCVRGGRELSARAVIVDAINDDAALFYQDFGFRPLDGARLWRRIADIEISIKD